METVFCALPLPEWLIGYALTSGDGRFASLSSPHGRCTVDFRQRCIRAGSNSTYGPAIGKHGATTYTGRGWLQRLHADAAAWLQEQR